jgi:hypothetical protein
MKVDGKQLTLFRVENFSENWHALMISNQKYVTNLKYFMILLKHEAKVWDT